MMVVAGPNMTLHEIYKQQQLEAGSYYVSDFD